MKRLLLLSLAAMFCLAFAAMHAAAANNNADAKGEVTFSEHVAPLLFENCVSCHRPGQVAPMSLLSYKDARPWARSIKRAVAARTMPPWFANPAHGEFVEDPRLTDQEIAMISKWVDAGAPSGDLDKMPEAPVFETDWQTGKQDVVLTMEPFQVTDEMEDHYEWVQVTNPLNEDKWIKSIEIRPTFTEGAHHNLTYIAPAGMTLDEVNGLRRTEMDFIAGWAPGVVPMQYREGYGKFLPAGASIFFQMHYHKEPGEGSGGIDETSVGLKFYDDEVDNALTTLWIVDPVLQIPPGEANYQSASEHVFDHEALIFNFTPHMHLRGKSMRFTATYPDGREEILLDVPDYDFNWQLTYSPPEPLKVPAGTKVVLDAVFDNSADNPANPDPTATVTFGEATTDEMMIGFLDYTYVDQDKQVDMPNYAVPPAMKEQWDRIRQLRRQQEQQEATSGRD